MPGHLCKRNSLGGFGVTNYSAGVVVRNKTFRNYIEERNCYQEENAANEYCQGPMLEHELQSPSITTDQPFVSAFGLLPPGASLCWERGRPARMFSAFRHGRATARF